MNNIDHKTISEKSRNAYIIHPEETILVTGANGFIGSKVVETLLSYGFKRVRCLVRTANKSNNIETLRQKYKATDVEIVKGNLLSRDACKIATEGVSIIYHLAAGTGKTFPDCFMNSVVATRNLLDAAVSHEKVKRFVNISSIAVYSNEKIRRGGLMDETCEVDTKLVERHEPYTYGKAKQDELVFEYAKNQNLRYVIVRPSVVYGPGKAKITDRVGTNTFGIFLHLGLNNNIPLTFVDNCAEAIVLAGLRKGIDGEVFNIVDDNLPKSYEFLRMYKRKVKKFLSIPVPYPTWFALNYFWEKYSEWSENQLPPVFNRMACKIYWKGNTYTNKKAKERLGWHPRIPMNEGLNRFFAFMKEVDGNQ